MWIRSSASAQASEVSTSDFTQDCERLAVLLERSAWWRGKPSALQSWRTRCRKATWTTLLSGLETSESYPLQAFPELTGSSVATLVSRSAQRAKDWEKTTLVICGQQSSSSPGLFDQEASSSKTSADTCRSASIASFKTWQDAVSAVRSDCLQRRKSAHLIEESASSSLAWPTPTVVHVKRGNHDESLDNFQRRVQNYKDGKTKGAPGKSLGVAVRMWPTPTQQNDPRHTTKTGVSHSGTSLIDMVRLWPTPLVSTGGPHKPEKNGPNLSGAVKTEAMRRNGLLNSDSNSTATSDGATPSDSASRSATDATMWPTPSANEDAAGKPGGKMQKMLGNHPEVRGLQGQGKTSTTGSLHGLLNPQWVDLLMGFPPGWTALTD